MATIATPETTLRWYREHTGAAASFNHPWGAAVDGVGNVYVADASNRIIRKVTPAGVVSPT